MDYFKEVYRCPEESSQSDFGELIRASHRWHKVPMSIVKQKQLLNLRKQLFEPKDPDQQSQKSKAV